MKNFVTQNSLRLLIGSFFVLSVMLSVVLFRYANQMVPAKNPRAVIASDTIVGDITIRNVDSPEFIH